MGKSQCDILAKQTGMLVRQRRVQKQPRKLRQFHIRQDLCGLVGEESGGSQKFELLFPAERQDSADTVEYVAADPAIT